MKQLNHEVCRRAAKTAAFSQYGSLLDISGTLRETNVTGKMDHE